MIPKFRGLSIDEKSKGEWQYGHLIEDRGRAFIINEVVEANEQYITIGSWCPVNPATLGQSTGLRDKNGKEIFEGDIVRTTRFLGRADEIGGFYEYDKEFIGIVKQLEGSWVIDTGSDAVCLWTEIEENEIIGNIYENKEFGGRK
ncbi:YopX protein [Streptococcus pneumoniae]|nr:YopX family protein [Streptococcus pneumoniae]VJE77174.1 YopX protein [Streptococcus pneumoniae]VLB37990.1 YopX protein [Streptococcus pneumoniae]VLZ74705.1 YopX protein [Streptococcus pneumoniae]VMI15732.1 YopX protein [Streptococcus pneumoniae]